MTVAIEPVQDLHGYDNPWPAGGGKNLIDPDTLINGYYDANGNAISSASYRSTPLIPVSPNTTYSGSFFDKSKTRIGALVFTFWDENGTFISQAPVAISVTTTAETAYVRIRTLQAQISYIENDNFLLYAEQGSSSNTFTPYSNICPISGHTSATVTRTGKNLLDQSKCIAKKYINANGGVYNSDNWCVSDYTPIKGGQTYTFSGYTAAGWSAYHAFYNSNKTFISAEYAINHSTFTAPNNATYVRLSIYTETPTVAQLELGSSATAYEPYQGQTVTIDLDGTRYGGTLNVLTGEMVVTDEFVAFTGTEDWRERTNYAPDEGFHSFWCQPFTNSVQNTWGTNITSFTSFCTHNNGNRGYTGRGNNYDIDNSGSIFVGTNLVADVTAWKSFLATANYQVCAKLATPFTIQLTPSQMSTLFGTNHLWANTGNSTVTLRFPTGDLAYQDTVDYETQVTNKPDSAPVITEIASGSIASFSDGSTLPVTALSVGIEPVQDLHGYDNPWPAGGGKNLIDPSKKTKYSNTQYYWYYEDGFMLEAGVTYTLSSDNVAGGAVYIRKKSDDVAIVGGHATETYTPTEDILVFFSNYKASDADLVNIMLEKSATATSYAPYSNICPISGWSSATVTRTGKNLGSATLYAEGKNINASGVIGTNANYNLYSAFLKAGTYTFSYTETYLDASTTFRALVYDKSDFSDTPTMVAEIANTSENRSATFTISKDKYLIAQFRITATNVQLELGSTASAYEPYQGTSVTIDLDGTRYGGTLNVLTGEMTVDRGYKEYDGSSDEVWRLENGTNFGVNFYINVSDALASQYGALFPNTKTNMIKISAANHAARGCFYISSGKNLNCTIGDILGFTTVAEWTTYLSTNPLQLVYELATPFTVTLSPSQISTLIGTNHIWADTSDVSVEYRADSKLYIDQAIAKSQKATRSMITTVADSMVAPINLTNGQIIIVGDDIYKLTTNVSSGANLVVGTNCQKATLAEWVTALTA